MSNSFGKLFVITSFGESHGQCVGVVVDGCPAGLDMSLEDIQREVDKRHPGRSAAFTARAEKNRVEILSGILDGYTTGAPIAMMIMNEDVDDSDYERIRHKLRPGHADYTANVKYGGFADWRGGGMFSGRITATYVMAGAIAKKLLAHVGIEIIAHTVEIGGITAAAIDYEAIKNQSEQDLLRCADSEAALKMTELISGVREAGDSVGGVIEGIALNVPAGLGEPVFETLEGELAKALLAIPAVKGVEFGAGFAAARMKGSENNDAFRVKDGKITTSTNNAGGILGGISNGMPVVVRVAVKPTPSIAVEQATADIEKIENTEISVGGRHDACIVPRAVVAVEAMMAVTMCDFALRAGVIPGVIK
ncbi:MAG: chorismate synthase [Dehalococcoidia bacterium]|jgi:chorismate synthase